MVRKAFRMKVFPDKIGGYIERHNPIWKELRDTLKANGVINYSIFLDSETHFLFGYVELESEAKWKLIAQTDICRKWWDYMKDLMETNPDSSPKSLDLQEVFQLI